MDQQSHLSYAREVKAASTLDVHALRNQFPALALRVHGHPLAYLDNASTTQKPQVVLDTVQNVYRRQCANIHRGVHHLSISATEAYEAVRAKAARFVGIDNEHEIVLTGGTTEGLNLVAQTYGRRFVGKDDDIIVTELEHHSNLVPWQILAEERGARLRVAPIDDHGQVRVDAFAELLSERTRIVTLAHVSNSLGTINPVARFARLAHEVGAVVVVDGAQAVPHLGVDVVALECDFYAFSGHKVYGPTGTGVLWGKSELLAIMPPWQGGGEMIRSVSFERTEYAPVPHRFEAGTPNIAGIIGLGAALDFVGELGLEAVAAHEATLLKYATEAISAIDGIRLYGTAENKAAVLSFLYRDVHPHDVGTILDREGIAIRTGHHCTEPVMTRFGIPATARASFGLYNTREEVDRLVASLGKVKQVFG